jgi:hypothetical protein
VRRFGRNDDFWVGDGEEQATTNATAKADPYGMTTRKANATTTANATANATADPPPTAKDDNQKNGRQQQR